MSQWLAREGCLKESIDDSVLVEAGVASHCFRNGKAYYFKGQGEVDVMWMRKDKLEAIEVKWSNPLRASDLKTLKQFKNSLILGKNPEKGEIEQIQVMPVYDFRYSISG